MKKYADIRVEFTICFDDDEDMDLLTQAIEWASDMIDVPIGEADIEVVGPVRDTDMPEQK
ncbi:hypothetical protein [Rhizobium sp. L51/94]|uniref:hypothetical protein n=1 Tax=Rhizobium sp. L51/94 TaxID=2819999 RepID=UPI001C5BB2C0|nr:hypothetical protein [Rhizobium sp. L51/94]QXZ79615.1 hypothetical protein J5274_06425 [Rhizobium sp. L51/94]